MRFKIVIIIIVLTISQVIFDSCCKINTTFTVKGVDVANLDNSGEIPTEVIDSIVSGVTKNAYGIRVYLASSINSSSFVDNTIKNAQFIGKSYALGCKQNYSLSNRIVSFKIYTVNDFDQYHKAGSDITEYFNGLNKEYGPYISIDQKINEINSLLTDLPDYFDIFLMNAPTEGDVHQFRIYMEFDDDYVVDDLKTKKIILF